MTTVAIPQKESWAEVPEEKVTEIIVKNEKGEDVRIIKTFREYLVPVKRNKKVDERRKWEKFGDCYGTNGMSNTSSGEEVFLTLSRNSVSEEEKKDVIVCRNCKRNHFTSKCPYKDAIELTQKSLNKPEKEEKQGESKYVLPSQRGGAYSPASPIEVPSLIVSNLSENANEKDLRDLFGRFGMVQKVNIPKLNDKPRGFAYITFTDLKAANEAIKHLNGHRYDFLVLSVDFARKKNKD